MSLTVYFSYSKAQKRQEILEIKADYSTQECGPELSYERYPEGTHSVYIKVVIVEDVKPLIESLSNASRR